MLAKETLLADYTVPDFLVDDVTDSTMDYKEGMKRSGFDFVNPNETGHCGCGESFTVAKA
jgi:Fe-S cluster assembly iron-binding protein IscA